MALQNEQLPRRGPRGRGTRHWAKNQRNRLIRRMIKKDIEAEIPKYRFWFD